MEWYWVRGLTLEQARAIEQYIVGKVSGMELRFRCKIVG